MPLGELTLISFCDKLNKDMNKKKIQKIVVSSLFLIMAFICQSFMLIEMSLGFFLVSYLVIGSDVVKNAIKNIYNKQFLDENSLMAIATIGAMAIGEYPEAVAVMLFYQVGELLQSYSVNKSRKSIADLMDIRPDYAYVERNKGIEKVDPKDLVIDDIIVIKAGERVAVDGVVIAGNAHLNTSALTGESKLKEVLVGDRILSGSINTDGLLRVRVANEYEQSTVAKILDLVENAYLKKSSTENFITKFARYYTPCVVIAALLLAVVPPLFIRGELLTDWIYRSLTFLVVSCPCALVISIPLSFFGGIGGLSRHGVLVKGSNYLEAMANSEVVVFDKTGTLTKGVFKLIGLYPKQISSDELLEYAAVIESVSNHPIALSIRRAYPKEVDNRRITDIKELAGFGIKAIIDDKLVCIGNDKLMERIGVGFQHINSYALVIHLAIDGEYCGYILLGDEIKDDAAHTMIDLKSMGIRKTVILTGDSKEISEKVANILEVDDVYSELLPTDKMSKIEDIMKIQSKDKKLIFVGDGINDAPVLVRADVGVAMGGIGSDAAIEAADVVIMTDQPSKIVTAIKISRKTLDIVKQNICFALAVKGIALLLGAFGMAMMWEAVFADVGVTILVVFNAMRAVKL